MTALVLDPWLRFLLFVRHRNDETARIVAVNRICRVWGVWTFAGVKAALGLRLVVEGTPPVSGRYLIVSNHQASADVPLLITVFRHLNLKFVAREDLRHGKPSVSLCLREGGFAFVAKEELGIDFAELSRFGGDMERFGGSPVIFPEGIRTEDGSILPWHYAGIEVVRRTTGLPILPVTIDGLWRGRTIGHLGRLVGSRVTVRISDPISFDAAQADPRNIYRGLENLIRRNLDEIRGEDQERPSRAAR